MPRRSERLAQHTAVDRAGSENGEAGEVVEMLEEDTITESRIGSYIFLIDVFDTQNRLIIDFGLQARHLSLLITMR